MLTNKSTTFGRWNDERSIDAHPRAHQALVDLGALAHVWIKKHPKGMRHVPAERSFLRFVGKSCR